MRYIIDLETDGLINQATKIHVVSVYNYETDKLYSLFGKKNITEFFSNLKETDEIIGHNFIRFDSQIVEKLCNITIKARIIDSLALSWYLYPQEKVHGLEEWGNRLGISKPKITDFLGLSKEKQEIINYFEHFYPKEQI